MNNTDTSSYYSFNKEEKELCDWIRVILNTGFGGIICAFGLVGNLVSYIILKKGRGAGAVATFLLRSLAMTDNFFLLIWFLNFSLRDVLRYVGYNSWAWRYARLYTYPLLYVAQSATICMTVLIAITRFAAVCLPYFAKRVCTLINVQIAVAIGYTLVISYNLPRFFELQLKDINGTAWIKPTWLGSNATYKFIYIEIMYYIFSFALPLLLLIVLNWRLTAAYRDVERRRQRLRITSRFQQDDTNVTLVMIVVVAVFLVCQGPGRLAQMIWSYKYGSCKAASFLIMEIATLLELLNSSVNFLIYCVIRPQFRMNFLAICYKPGMSEDNNERPHDNSIMLQIQSAAAEPKTDVTSCGTEHINMIKGLDNMREECRPFLYNTDMNNIQESDV